MYSCTDTCTLLACLGYSISESELFPCYFLFPPLRFLAGLADFFGDALAGEAFDSSGAGVTVTRGSGLVLTADFFLGESHRCIKLIVTEAIVPVIRRRSHLGAMAAHPYRNAENFANLLRYGALII